MGRASEAFERHVAGNVDASGRRSLNSQYGRDAARKAGDAIRSKSNGFTPQVAIVLGSGLGGLANDIENAIRVSYEDIPGFPTPTVVGHAGEVVLGHLGGKPVA